MGLVIGFPKTSRDRWRSTDPRRLSCHVKAKVSVRAMAMIKRPFANLAEEACNFQGRGSQSRTSPNHGPD
jgi:hypothetical protein